METIEDTFPNSTKKDRLTISTYDQATPSAGKVKEESFNLTEASTLTGTLLEMERIAAREGMKYLTNYLWSKEKAIRIDKILDEPDEVKKVPKDELQEILQSAQRELETVVEFKGRVIALSNDIAEITVYEESRNVTYTNLDPEYLTDAGLAQGDSFILKIVNDHGIEVPIFKPDEEELERIKREIGAKSEETRKEASDSQKDLDELYNFIKSNDPKK